PVRALRRPPDKPPDQPRATPRRPMTATPAEPLIAPEALHSRLGAPCLRARLGDPGLRLVDVRWYLGQPGRGRAAYEAGHIPGAIFFDLDTDLSAPVG